MKITHTYTTKKTFDFEVSNGNFLKDFVGDPGEVNGPWFLPVKTLFTFLDKLLTQKK